MFPTETQGDNESYHDWYPGYPLIPTLRIHHINREHFAKYGVYLPVENFISTE